MNTDLSIKMVEIADRDKLPENHEMRIKAAEFDKATRGGEAKKTLGAWARARRVYCDYTGESLV